MFELIVVIGVLVAIGVGSWAGSRHFRRRRALGSLALRLGLRFSPVDRQGLGEEFGGCYLMQLGHSGRLNNIMQGKRRGERVVAFDYAYEVGSGPSRSTREVSVVAWQVGGPGGSVVGVSSGRFMRLGRYENFEAVATGDEELDAAWRVYTEEPAAAAWAGSGMGRLLRGWEGLDWQRYGGWLMFWTERLGPGGVVRLMGRTRKLKMKNAGS